MDPVPSALRPTSERQLALGSFWSDEVMSSAILRDEAAIAAAQLTYNAVLGENLSMAVVATNPGFWRYFLIRVKPDFTQEIFAFL